MPTFFESIASNKSRAPLLAAWAVEGPFAGGKALFALEGDKWTEVSRDAAFPAGFVDALRDWPRWACGIAAWDGARVFLEPLSMGRKLVVCGAGHVSMPVIRIASMLDYEVTAIDDREAFAERAKAAGARNAVCKPFAEALGEIDGDSATAFVIMTREHAHDVECLRLILNKPRGYVGMMGSRSRTEGIRRQLLDGGFDAGAVAEVRMPIGLPIGSRTPEEIAVSVMAEVIQVMNASDAGEGFPQGMAEALAKPDGDAVLAMIVEKNGEAPRRPGTKMLVLPKGRFMGTVGGGSAEAMILRTAGDMLGHGCREPRLVRITLEKGTMACGGDIAVFLLPLNATGGSER